METNVRETVLKLVSLHARPRGLAPESLANNAVLVDLGIDSMMMITILLELEAALKVKFDTTFGIKPPKTVEDVLNLVQTAARR